MIKVKNMKVNNPAKIQPVRSVRSVRSIRSSNWARRLKRSLGPGSSYEEGIQIAQKLQSGEIPSVFLNHNNENGYWVWSIQPFVVFGNLGEYWLDVKPTKKEAEQVCREMGWKVKQ